MSLVNINFKPDAKELRQFGKTMIVGFSIFALIAFFWFHKPGFAIGLALFGLLSYVLSFFGKAAMIVYIPWMAIGFVMGTIVSNVILMLLYFGMITPIAIVFKLMGRDPMQRSLEPTASTYWSDAVDRDSQTIEDYKRQF